MTELTVQEIIEKPVTGMAGRTPRTEITQASERANGREREPMLLIDWSGSENEQASPDSPVTKVEVIKQAVPIIVRALASRDSQGKNEEGGGGLRTFLFDIPNAIEFAEGEDESDDVRDLKDLNEANVVEVLAGLYTPEYQTYGMPAIRAAEHAYQAEFGDRPLRNRPAMEVVIITDGQLSDHAEFEAWVAQADETCIISVAIIGYGHGHDQAVDHYRAIAANNKFVSVTCLTGVSDPNEVALDIQLMAA